MDRPYYVFLTLPLLTTSHSRPRLAGSKTYLDLPSLIEPPEYSIVICADDDEYAGRGKVLQNVRLFFLYSVTPAQWARTHCVRSY